MWLLTLGLKLYERGLNIFSSAFSLRLLTSIIPDKGSLLSFTRSTEATVPDHEGLVQLCDAEEARFYGARRVKNLISKSEDFSIWVNVTSATISAAGHITVNGETSWLVSHFFLSAQDTGGRSFRAQFKIKKSNPSENGTVEFLIREQTGSSTARQSAVYTLTDEYEVVTTNVYSPDADSKGVYLIFKDPTGDITEFDIAEMQVEEITGQTNKNPSEYVSTGVGTEPESILYNNDFTQDGLGWSDPGAPYLTTYSNNQVTINRNGSGSIIWYRRSDILIKEKALYLVTLDVESFTNGVSYQVNLGGTGSPYLTQAGTITFLIRAETFGDFQISPTQSINGILVLNSVSIKEIQHGSNVDGVKYFPYENGNTVDVNNVVVEEQGAPLTTMQGYLNEPGSTNSCLQSRDFTVWSLGSGGAVTKDQIGMDGKPNSACLITDNSDTFYGVIYQTIDIASNTNTHTLSVRIMKDNDESRFPEIQLTYIGGVEQKRFIQLNTKTGEFVSRVPVGEAQISVELVGLFWVIVVSLTNTIGNTSATVKVYPAVSATFGSVQIVATGSIILDQVQFEQNIAYPTSPIVTTTAAVARSADTLLYDFQPNPLNGATVATVNRSHYVGGVSTHLLSNSPACRWIYHTTNTQSSDGTNSAEYIIGISPNLRSDSFGLTWVGEESKTVSYINGSQVAVKVLDSDGFVSGSDPLGIGCLGSSKTNQHIGCYRDIKFYNTALSKFIMEDSTK